MQQGITVLACKFVVTIADFSEVKVVVPLFLSSWSSLSLTWMLRCVASLNGMPSCANKRLLTDTLRHAWNFSGYVVSDDDALEHIVDAHHYLPTYVEAAAAAVHAGCNLELTGDASGWVYSYLPQVRLTVTVGLACKNWLMKCWDSWNVMPAGTACRRVLSWCYDDG